MVIRQRDCDLNDPRQRFLWALEGISYNRAPVAIPRPIREEWSEHLSRAGFVHVSQLEQFADSEGKVSLADLPFRQEIHFQPPVRGTDHYMNLSGSWKSVEDPIEEPLVPTVSRMSDAEKAQMLREFREDGLID